MSGSTCVDIRFPRIPLAVLAAVALLLGASRSAMAGSLELRANFSQCDYCACTTSAPLTVDVPPGRIYMKLHIVGWSPTNKAGHPMWIAFNGLRRNSSGWTGWSFPISEVSEGRIRVVNSKLTPENPVPGSEIWWEQEAVANETIRIQVMLTSESYHDGSGACHQGTSQHVFTIETGGATASTNLAPTPTPSVPAGSNLALGKPSQLSSLYAPAYAPVKCNDGSRGSFCHTQSELNPWWQVDLQASYQLSEIVVYNRQDGWGERERTLCVLVSSDGRNWQRIYAHNGTDFSVIRVPASGRTARFVRVQLNARDYMNVAEVEVYGR